MKTLAEVRGEMARNRPRIQTADLAKQLGMSYGRCSTLLNADPLLELTPEGSRTISKAVEALRSAAVA